MSLETSIDLRLTDRRPMAVAIATAIVLLLVAAALLEQAVSPGMRLTIASIALLAAAAAHVGRRRSGPARHLRIDPAGCLWLSLSATDTAGLPVPQVEQPCRLAGAWRIGGWCWLDLRWSPASAPQPPGRHAVARTGVAARGFIANHAQSLLSNSRPRRVVLLLARRPMTAQWPALMRWLVWHRRTGC